MRVIRNADNKLMLGRMKGEQFQVRDIQKLTPWQNAVIHDYREIKTKTIECTFVDHSMSCKKSFKVGKRYQIEQGRVLGGVAGYVFDDDGDRFTLYRETAGFSAGGVYLFQAKYF